MGVPSFVSIPDESARMRLTSAVVLGESGALDGMTCRIAVS
jgi:hypothetical protein